MLAYGYPLLSVLWPIVLVAVAVVVVFVPVNGTAIYFIARPSGAE